MRASVLVGILLSMIFFSCKAKKEEIRELDNIQNIHRKWMLIQFEDFEKKELTEKKCFLDLTNTKYAAAEMGCNTIGFEYVVKKDNSITISQLQSTDMYCEENKIESKFISAFINVENFKIEGQKIIFKTKSNQELTFVAADWD